MDFGRNVGILLIFFFFQAVLMCGVFYFFDWCFYEAPWYDFPDLMAEGSSNYLCQTSWERELIANLNLPKHVNSDLCKAAGRILGLCSWKPAKKRARCLLRPLPGLGWFSAFVQQMCVLQDPLTPSACPPSELGSGQQIGGEMLLIFSLFPWAAEIQSFSAVREAN